MQDDRQLAGEIKTTSEQLTSCDFRDLLASNKARHYAGTREWLFEAVRSWLRTEQRLFWLVGGAGTGKSVISAKLFDTAQVKESIVAWHFCRHNYAAENDFRVIVQSWVAMFIDNLPGFELPKDARQAFSENAEEMFELLVARPLKSMESPERPVLIVLDALDELPQKSLRPMLSLLTDIFPSLPSFVRIFITSRDEALIKFHLREFVPLELRVDDIRNREDLRSYLAEVARRHVNMELTVADMEAKLEREFGLHPSALKGTLSELEQPIRKSKDTYDVVVQKLKTQPGYQKICEIAQMQTLHTQEQNDLNVLYEDAGAARENLLKKFASEWEVYKTIGNTVLRIPAAGKAAPFVDRVLDPGLKELSSAQRKIRDDYGGKACFMKDLARLTAECRNCDRLAQVLAFLDEQSDLKVCGRKNKFSNPSPLGYRDFNLCVRMQLDHGRSHLCEIQVNIEDMLVAKDMAHNHYEKIREVLPAICQKVGIDRNKFETSVLHTLKNSVLDSVVHDMEQKAEGLFLYASLVARQLEEEKSLIDISQLLRRLPNGLSDIYFSNFARIGEWKSFQRVIAMVAVVREPLLSSLALQAVGSEYEAIVGALSVMFPVREGRVEVAHKSVIDWLLDESRISEDYALTSHDVKAAHRELATTLLNRVQECLRTPQEWEIKKADEETMFALRHVVYHLCHGGMIQEAQAFVLNFDWLLARAALNEPAALLEDVEMVRKASSSSTVALLAKAIKLALPILYEDWRYLPSQLVGRLIGSEQSAEIKRLLDIVREWKGPHDGRGWWCPMQQTFEPAGGNIVLTFTQSNTIYSLSWSPDCKHLAISEENLVRIWNAETGTCVQSLMGHTEAVTSVAYSPDFQVCSGSNDGTVRVWVVDNGECVRILVGHSLNVSCVGWSTDSSRICSGSWDKTVRVWLVASGECMQTLTGHIGDVQTVAWSKEDILCSGDDRGAVRVWSKRSGEMWECTQIISDAEEEASVRSVAFSAQGRICTGGRGKPVQIWEMKSGDFTCMHTLTDLTSSDTTSVSWSADESRVCTGNEDGRVRVWNLQREERIQKFIADEESVLAVAFNEQGKICSGGMLGKVYVFDVANTEYVEAFNGHENSVNTIAWSGDDRVCTGSSDEALRVWSVSSGECIQTLNGQTRQICAIAWSLTGLICSGSDMIENEDMAVCIWDPASGNCLQTLNGHEARVTSVAWDSSSTRVCSGSSDNTIRVWMVESGECVKVFTVPAGAVTTVTWSLNGEICSGGEDEIVRIWRVDSDESVQTLIGHTGTVSAVAWSSDGTRVCSASENREDVVRVWEVKTGACLQQLVADGLSFDFVAWTTDGKVFGDDNLNRGGWVWDPTSGQTLFDTVITLSSFRHADKLRSRAKSDALGLFLQMNLSICPSHPQRAIAHSTTFIHPVVLRGGRFQSQKTSNDKSLELGV